MGVKGSQVGKPPSPSRGSLYPCLSLLLPAPHLGATLFRYDAVATIRSRVQGWTGLAPWAYLLCTPYSVLVDELSRPFDHSQQYFVQTGRLI